MNGPPDFRFRRPPWGDRTPLSGVLVSVIIIVVGVAMLTDNLGLFRFHDLWTFAPLILVALGLIKIIEARGAHSSVLFGGLMVAGGTFWLLDNLDLLRFNAGLIWPVIIIGVGVTALIKTIERQRGIPPGGVPGGAADGADGPVHLYAFFGGNKRSISDPDFRGGDATSIFGGIEIDLRNAAIAGPRTVLDVNIMFGGLDIKVPPTWNVSTKAFSIFGGVEDNTAHATASGAPEFIITGTVMFGGISVKN